MAEYAYMVMYLPRGMTRDTARRVLTDHAEYGQWELSRLRLYADGSRKVTLRRKIIRAVRTLWTGAFPRFADPIFDRRIRPRVPARPEVELRGGQFSSRLTGGDVSSASDTRGPPTADGEQREHTGGDGRRPARQHPGQVGAGGGQQ